MQPLALEIGFSETVFVLPPEQDGHARMRIFTPSVELPFAGHPTLGTAFVLGAPLQLGADRARDGCRSRAGRARARRIGADRLRPHATAGAGGQLVRRHRDRSTGRWGSSVPSSRSRSTTTAFSTSTSPSPTRTPWRRSGRTWRRWRSSTSSASTASPAAATRWKTRMFSPADGVGEDAATGSAAGPARLPPRPPRTDRLGRRDRDRAGRGDRAPVAAVRPRGGTRRPDRRRRGRRLGRRRRPGRVPALRAAPGLRLQRSGPEIGGSRRSRPTSRPCPRVRKPDRSSQAGRSCPTPFGRVK